MKKFQTLTIGLFLLSTTAFCQEKEQLTVPLTDPTKEGKLHVSLVTGSIKVVGYDGKDVMVEAIAMDDKKRRNNNENHNSNQNSNEKGNGIGAGMRKINTEAGFEITAKESNNQVNVSVDKVNMQIDLSIKVPRKFALKISAVNEGDVTVENVSGNIETRNVNGNIYLKNVSGAVSANTTNGDVIVNLLEVNPNTPMAFTTFNENVDVTFPANIKANIKVKSDQGDVYSDFDIDIDKNPKKIDVTASKEKGMYKIKKDEWTYGKINGGGAEILMKTFNGNVYIRKK